VCSEVHHGERAVTAAGFRARAAAWFASCGAARVEGVLTDNGPCYRSSQRRQARHRTRTAHKRTRAYPPQTNGKLERFHRILIEERAHIRHWTSETQRQHAYTGFICYYNHHRSHGALNWATPASTLNDNLPEEHT